MLVALIKFLTFFKSRKVVTLSHLNITSSGKNVKGTVMQIEKTLINYRLPVPKIS